MKLYAKLNYTKTFPDPSDNWGSSVRTKKYYCTAARIVISSYEWLCDDTRDEPLNINKHKVSEPSIRSVFLTSHLHIHLKRFCGIVLKCIWYDWRYLDDWYRKSILYTPRNFHRPVDKAKLLIIIRSTTGDLKPNTIDNI